jgi:hypothetical protein
MKQHSNAACVGALVLVLSSPVLGFWTISFPTGGGTYGQYATISGSGPADAADVGEVGVFAFGMISSVNAQGDVLSIVEENTTNVTAYQIMPGMAAWQTATGQLAAPANGWSKSNVHPQTQTVLQDHAASIAEPDFPSAPEFSGKCSVWW